MQALHAPSPMTSTLSAKSRGSFSEIDPESHVYIVRTESPQWSWSTIECRMWLLRLLRDYMGLEPDVAVRYALQFDGQGSTLLRQPAERWMADFGDSLGDVIYTTINGYHGQ
ncbi:hypothetical protein GLAREA_05109 [Glarea lozoyensis ATCC 20868]|uniref:Uncharacterized protein n=1 Tax=Glarea lozoyensis (strain ATCC 20868 / MF5171) TaxID=1116229 RepID=S3DV27_GLAL2|nr:uncharacterized protein GLAREA_05109 [Glarea lozoyensis ATCC 20868]EPE35771.1 hypothetical protein GLAREA_05109 [Glarea lozoyensis ATCC 20868]